MKNALTLDEGFDTALDVLRSGGLVAVPTETVYGLGADATNPSAVAGIFKAKGRPSFNPLIAHVSGLEMAEDFGVFSDLGRQLARHFWPGPLTLVVSLKEKADVAPAVVAGLTTIALRYPNGTMAELASALGKPIAAPSANSSGKISPTAAEHVAYDIGDKVDLILDGGACSIGLESTIVKVENDNVTLLREGGVASEVLEAFLGKPLLRTISEPEIEAPGQMLAHYAPSLPLRLNARELNNDEALLAFGNPMANDETNCLNLSPSGDLEEAAHNLFAMMKTLDNSGASGIAVMPIPNHGLGAAINDRLKRAAHGKE